MALKDSYNNLNVHHKINTRTLEDSEKYNAEGKKGFHRAYKPYCQTVHFQAECPYYLDEEAHIKTHSHCHSSSKKVLFDLKF